MGDLEEAEAGKGCREEKIHMDKIDFANESLPVRPSRPDKSGLARISGHLGKIARITPGFFSFYPDFLIFCTFSALLRYLLVLAADRGIVF